MKNVLRTTYNKKIISPTRHNNLEVVKQIASHMKKRKKDRREVTLYH